MADNINSARKRRFGVIPFLLVLVAFLGVFLFVALKSRAGPPADELVMAFVTADLDRAKAVTAPQQWEMLQEAMKGRQPFSCPIDGWFDEETGIGGAGSHDDQTNSWNWGLVYQRASSNVPWNKMKQILYMLIGPKGAGKSHIGVLVNDHTDIHFLRVEPLWLGLQPGEDGWRKVELTIDTLFQKHSKVMIESLGVGEGFRGLFAALAKKYPIKLIRIKADLDTCLARVKSRNRAEHIAVSDEKVREYNQMAAGVTHNWDLEIDNNGPAEDADIISAILALDKIASQE